MPLIEPAILPPLDPGFRPAALANRAFRHAAGQSGERLVICLERAPGDVSRYETIVLPAGHPDAQANLDYTERLVKFLVWQRGAQRIWIGGPPAVGAYIQACYAANGLRRFEREFMQEQVYLRPFEVIACAADEAPESAEQGRRLGGHLEGCRIGFDLGASDRKVSAVVDGVAVYSEETIWEPGKQADPDYHYREIKGAIQTAAAHLPRVDAIGGSSAGIFIDNRPMVASLFRSVPPERYGEIRGLFQRIRAEMGVPLEVINDGDVTALAGAMALGENGILGIAMGSSQAGGYVDPHGRIRPWLSELAFAPVDYSPGAALDDWSGDRGCGGLYFSQQCVFRLAPQAGIEIPGELTLAAQLKLVQEKLEAGHPGAVKIWQSMGVYLGYALAHYADFYEFKHALILGRCTSGSGGGLILENANRVLQAEFPDLAARLHIQLPDERTRRVGQAIAAASLPEIPA